VNQDRTNEVILPFKGTKPQENILATDKGDGDESSIPHGILTTSHLYFGHSCCVAESSG
jgi:hypothetical protein